MVEHHRHTGDASGPPLDGSRSLMDASVAKAKVKLATVPITVVAGATSGSSPADASLVDGEILGYYPTGNQDQFVDSIALGADGSVTITLAAAATANNTFNVIILKV